MRCIELTMLYEFNMLPLPLNRLLAIYFLYTYENKNFAETESGRYPLDG